MDGTQQLIDAKQPDPALATRVNRIVVLDGATLSPGGGSGDNSWEAVAALGPLEVHERTSPGLVLARAQGADVLLTNKTPLDAAVLAALPDLKLVCVLATGVNVVDLQAAARCGITVCNIPAYSIDSVAQHVFALLLQLTNAVAEHSSAVANGEWASSPDFSFCKRPLTELAGKTMGIVGYGQIGARAGEIARAFGMRVLGFSPSRSRPVTHDGFRWASVAEVFAESEVVSLHCPLTAANVRFVDAGLLATMREGSILLNTARGGLIDEVALARALDLGRPAAAALDVLSAEPPPIGHLLVAHPRCLVTPHIAWATLAARRRLMAVAAQNIRAYTLGRPQNVVSAPEAKGEPRP